MKPTQEQKTILQPYLDNKSGYYNELREMPLRTFKHFENAIFEAKRTAKFLKWLQADDHEGDAAHEYAINKYNR